MEARRSRRLLERKVHPATQSPVEETRGRRLRTSAASSGVFQHLEASWAARASCDRRRTCARGLSAKELGVRLVTEYGLKKLPTSCEVHLAYLML